MPIPSDVVFWWPSTAASIPAGWTRDTRFDSKYVQGAPAAGDSDFTARGKATHIHTSPAHTPTQNAHSHDVSAPGGDPDTLQTVAVGAAYTVATDSHTHGVVTSPAKTVTNGAVTITVNANTANDPPYIDVIAIKSAGTPLGVPANALALYAFDILPYAWARVYGNRFLRGAAAAGNGGGTGGASTHAHTSPAHTHTSGNHQHPATFTSAAGSGGGPVLAGGTPISLATHTHDLDLDSAAGSNQSVTTTIDAADHEPVFKKYNIIQNNTADDSLPNEIIGLWGGTNATIPVGWLRETGLDGYFPKGANANGEVATTGGSLTHTHTASNCQPTQNSHTHTVSDYGGSAGASGELTGGVAAVAASGHIHTWTVSSETPTNNAVTVTIDGSGFVITAVAATDVITTKNSAGVAYAHGKAINDPIVFDTTGGGITAGVQYWVKTVPTSSTMTISATAGPGALFDITSDITGTGTKTTAEAYPPYVRAIFIKAMVGNPRIDHARRANALTQSWNVAAPIQTAQRRLIAPPMPAPSRGWLATVLASWGGPDPTATVRRPAPPQTPMVAVRAWLSTILASWQDSAPTQPPRRPVPPATPLVAARAWLSGVVASWQEAPPTPQRARKLAVDLLAPLVEPLFKSRVWLSIVDAWHRPVYEAPPRRSPVPQTPAILSPRRWLSTVLDWWRSAELPWRRPARFPRARTITPLPPPAPADVCFPPVAPPATAFTRLAVANPGYARGTIATGSYARQTLAALGQTRQSFSGPAFARMDEPDCVHPDEGPITPVPRGMGYGFSYGVSYGGD